jgi:hypothetical protein
MRKSIVAFDPVVAAGFIAFAGAYSTARRSMSMGRLEGYKQEAFEASRRWQASPTYPGAIRAATPGDTKFYLNGFGETVLNRNERHYWRAVVDDPQVESTVTLRIRLKDNVWCTSGWETRMHVVQVVVPKSATISELVHQVVTDNQSPYLCVSTLGIAVDGRDLAMEETVETCGLDEYSLIDGYEIAHDHLSHTAEHRPKDWNSDELSDADLQSSPYKEMAPFAGMSLAPRYEGRPQAFAGRRHYGSVRPESPQ